MRIGIDVQPIEEVERSMIAFGPRYTSRLFTDAELAACGTDPLTSSSRLAARFAAKEAVLKVLDPIDVVPTWKSIEVRATPSGRPEIALSEDAARLASDQGLGAITISLSHAGGVAVAVAVAETLERESARP